MPFDGLRVLSLESRRANEIDLLIRKQGGNPFVAPAVKEKPLEDHTDAFQLLEALEQNRFELLVLMTGVGLQFWLDVVETKAPATRVNEALTNVKLLARGPKPSAVLRSRGLAPDITVPEPNTWREIVRELGGRTERKIAVQEYGRPNPEFIDALKQLGAEPQAFALYRWELPENTEPLQIAVKKLAAREVDVVLFTSSVQLENLLQVAAQELLDQTVVETLRENVAVASVGPIMSGTLTEHGIAADIEPTSPKMGLLVKTAADNAAAVLAQKRKRPA